jgi:hypothetical protein
MAETMNGKVQRTVVRKVAPVKLNDADARKTCKRDAKSSTSALLRTLRRQRREATA